MLCCELGRAWLLLAVLLGGMEGPCRLCYGRFAGFQGCKFSSSVCQSDETCIDDHLFGSCQKKGAPADRFHYSLDSDTFQALEGEIYRLTKEGFSWENLYTQCVLGNILVAFRKGIQHDPQWCDREGAYFFQAPQSKLDDQTFGQLEKYFDYYYSDPKSYQSGPDLGKQDFEMSEEAPHDLNKKVGEYLKIHKYVPLTDKRTAPRTESQDYSYYPDGGYKSQLSDYQRQLSGYSRDDVKTVEDSPQDEDGSLQTDLFDLSMEPKRTNLDLDSRGHIWGDQPLFNTVVNVLSQAKQNSGNMKIDEDLDNLPNADKMTSQDDTAQLDGLKAPGSKKAVTKKQVNKVLLKNSLLLHGDAKLAGKKAYIAGESMNVSQMTPNVQSGKAEDAADIQLTEASHYKQIHTEYANIKLEKPLADLEEAEEIVRNMEKHMKLPPDTFSKISFDGGYVMFQVFAKNTSASQVAKEVEDNRASLSQRLGVNIESAGIGDEVKVTATEHATNSEYFELTVIVCAFIVVVVISIIIIFLIKRHMRSGEKLEQLTATEESSQLTQDYQDLCRQHMQSKAAEKPQPFSTASRVDSISESAERSPSSRSSTSSWSEEPANSSMDISTGHIVLSYMEDHLKNKDRLDREWEALCAYEAEPSSTKIGTDAKNLRKNRYSDIVPYDHSRVVLNTVYNVSGSDFINASNITDHDPRNPAYICTQSPLPHTVADFWQLVWEQGSVVIVNLTKLTENGVAMCHRYWPEEGSELYHIYEVHLVSEHIWCDDYLVRSFYLKNLQTNETRTVTQFHFLTWLDLDLPASTKALLDFRRKVNKSYKGRSCPVVLHCSDGVGRTGTYCLIDMVLNRMSKGAKEIDIAATLEHIRDQRMSMVKTKEQFEFALVAVAEEVHNILKALP